MPTKTKRDTHVLRWLEGTPEEFMEELSNHISNFKESHPDSSNLRLELDTMEYEYGDGVYAAIIINYDRPMTTEEIKQVEEDASRAKQNRRRLYETLAKEFKDKK